MNINIDGVFKYANSNIKYENSKKDETRLKSHKPENRFRPSTIYHTIRDPETKEILEPKQLDIVKYNKAFEDFGNAENPYSLRRAASFNRTMNIELLEDSEQEEKFFEEYIWLNIFHVFGHVDSQVIYGRNPREIHQYFKAFYPIKSNAINDVLVLKSKKDNDEKMKAIFEMLENRIKFLLGKDLELEGNFSRTEYNIEKMQKTVDRINDILQKDDASEVEKLLNYLSLCVQEAILLCITLSYLVEIMSNDQSLAEYVKNYSQKLEGFINSNNLNLFFVKNFSDEIKYRMMKYFDGIMEKRNIQNFTLPVNMIMYSTRMAAGLNVSSLNENYSKKGLEKAYELSPEDTEAIIQLKKICSLIPQNIITEILNFDDLTKILINRYYSLTQ